MGYYCGIDLGNKESVVCILSSDRHLVAEERLLTTSDGIRRIFEKRRKMECLVEASPLAEFVCGEVEKYGHKISIVCPRKAKVAVLSQKKKTDQRDARALAELCRSGWYEAVHRKSKEARELRSFLVARKQLVESSSSIASSLRGILRAHGIKLSCRSNDERFAEEVRQASNELPPLARAGIVELLRSFETLHFQQRAMYKLLQMHSRRTKVISRLETIPGVGAATAAAFVATVDDPHRFESAEKVASYLGLTPSVYQSGEAEYRGRITKTGDKLLRWLLVEAAHVMLSRSKVESELRTWGLKLKEAKGAGKAHVAVARRLCGVMWKMWKDEVDFYPERVPA